MAECIIDTFGIVQDFADLHGDMSTPLYQAIMDVMVSRQREEIVRCRDCKHFRIEPWDEVLAAQYGAPPMICERTGDMDDVDPDGFCAWGERGEDE